MITFAAQFLVHYMKTDKNTIIGFVLLGILFFAFFWYTNKQQQAVLSEKKRIADSTAAVNAARARITDTAAANAAARRNDSTVKAATSGNFTGAASGTEQTLVVENNVMKVTFSNKGGQVKSVELKNYRSSTDSSLVVLGGSASDNISYSVYTGQHAAQTSDLFFTASQVTKNADGSQTISYNLADSNGESITHQYVVRPDNYMIDWNVALTGADKLLASNSLNLLWNYTLKQQQTSVSYERQQSRVCYVEDGGFDFKRAGNGSTKQDFSKPVDWVSNKQQFFNATLVTAKDKIQSGSVELTQQPDSSRLLYASNAALQVKVTPGAVASVPMQLYFGPNDYYVLKKFDNKMENIVDLGTGMFAFVKYINRWIIMPVFNFFAGFVGNYGWVIALLTLFIRLVTSPLTYSSYVSGAKMKVLRPELDALKKKFGTDQQGFAMEQMKLFREAGVNPLGGCIPALLQIPIFFALSSYFGSNILLRGQSFLWAHDLSASDTIFKFHTLPIIGDHISLFTITAIITSFLISIYNMSMTPTQDNPAMKYMPYIFPFILFFVFNNLSSALTWYYTVSNLITLGLQFVIQHYIIDHAKILAKIEQKRKAPKTQSKWQERYSQMMDAQKKVQDLKEKNKK